MGQTLFLNKITTVQNQTWNLHYHRQQRWLILYSDIFVVKCNKQSKAVTQVHLRDKWNMLRHLTLRLTYLTYLLISLIVVEVLHITTFLSLDQVICRPPKSARSQEDLTSRRIHSWPIFQDFSVRNPLWFLYNVSKLAKQCRGRWSVGNTRGVTSFCQWNWNSVSLTVTLHTKVKILFNIYTLDLKMMDLEFFSWFSNTE